LQAITETELIDEQLRADPANLSHARAFWDLLLIQLANWRWSWPATLINGLLVPLTALFFLRAAAGDNLASAEFLVSGNIIISLIFTTMYGTSARFSFMRTFGVLDYYATLPVSKIWLVLAVNTGFLILTLPSSLLTIVIAQLFGLHFQVNFFFLLIVPLASFSLSAVGAFVGVAAPNFDTANTITGILQFLFMGCGPILIPADRLPDFLNVIGHLLPSTYAADAMRHALSGSFDTAFLLDMVFLVVFDFLAMFFVARRMEWRRG
jgi:ABC-2 type transport system permease protein